MLLTIWAEQSHTQDFLWVPSYFPLFATAHSARQKGHGQHAAIRTEGKLRHLYIIFFSLKFNFQISGKSHLWLLRYSTLNIWGRLPLEVTLVLVWKLGKIILEVTEILKFQNLYCQVAGGWLFWEENNATLKVMLELHSSWDSKIGPSFAIFDATFCLQRARAAHALVQAYNDGSYLQISEPPIPHWEDRIKKLIGSK